MLSNNNKNVFFFGSMERVKSWAGDDAWHRIECENISRTELAARNAVDVETISFLSDWCGAFMPVSYLLLWL